MASKPVGVSSVPASTGVSVAALAEKLSILAGSGKLADREWRIRNRCQWHRKAKSSVRHLLYGERRERGLMGQNPDDQKWLPMTPEGQEHLRGWNDGQAVLMAKFRDIETGMTEAEKAEKKEAEAKAAKKAAKAAKAAEPKKGRGKKDAAEAEAAATEASATPEDTKPAVH